MRTTVDSDIYNDNNDKKMKKVDYKKSSMPLTINLMADKFNDMVNNTDNNDNTIYVRRKKVTRQLEDRENRTTDVVHSNNDVHHNSIYDKCMKMKDIILPDDDVYITLSNHDLSQIGNNRIDKRAVLTLEHIRSAYKNTWYNDIKDKYNYTDEEHNHVNEMIGIMIDRLTEDTIHKTNESIKQSYDFEPKRDNPLNIYQMDRKNVIEDIERMIDDMNESVNDTYRYINEEFIRDIEEKVIDTMKDIRSIEYTDDIDNKLDTINRESLNNIGNNIDSIIQSSIYNEQKIVDIFNQLVMMNEDLETIDSSMISTYISSYESLYNINGIDIIRSIINTNN